MDLVALAAGTVPLTLWVAIVLRWWLFLDVLCGDEEIAEWAILRPLRLTSCLLPIGASASFLAAVAWNRTDFGRAERLLSDWLDALGLKNKVPPGNDLHQESVIH